MSNFTQYKVRFNNDTGVRADSNIPLYLLYIECVKNGITYNQYKVQFQNETKLSADQNKETYLNWVIANFVNGGSGDSFWEEDGTTTIKPIDDKTVEAENISGLADVATSGSYNDLSDTPTIPSDDTEIALSETYTGNLIDATTVKDAMDVLDAFEEGVSVHNDLTDRDANDCHPISAITGLTELVTTTVLSSNALTFDGFYQYGSTASARAGDITVDFTDAKLGVIQTMFHDDTELPPEILSNSVFILVQGYYEPSTINRISFEIIDITAGSEVVLVTVIPVE